MIGVYILLSINIIVFICLLFVSERKMGTLVNTYTTYNLVWILFPSMSLFLNSYIRPISYDVYVIFFVGALFFNLTYLLTPPFRIGECCNSIQIDLRKRRILELIVIVSLLPTAYANYKLIQSGVELWRLNYEYWHEARNAGSYLYNAYVQSVVGPMSILLVCTSYANVNLYKNASKHSAFINVCLAILISIEYFLLSGGGRAQLMSFVFVSVFSYVASFNKSLRDYFYRPSKKQLLLFIIAFLLLINFANEGRGKQGSFLQNLIDGYNIAPPLFEYYYTRTDLFSHHMYGCSMFEFFVQLLQYPFKLAGITFYDVQNNDIVQNFVYVPALGKETNAGVTAFFYYMRDFGLLGVAIGPVIYAFLLNSLQRKCSNNAFLLVFFYGGFMSLCFSTGFAFSKNTWLMLIYLYLFVRISKKKSFG